MQKKTLFIQSLLIFSLTIFSTTSSSQPYENTKLSNLNHIYLTIGASRNFPVSMSKMNYHADLSHPTLGMSYRHENLYVGVSSRFRLFHHIESNSEFSLWTLEQESAYLLRLYHPLYLKFGAKILYLYPTQRAMIPLKKHSDHLIEIGIAASCSLIYLGDKEDRFGYGLFIDRWRGTATRKFQGVELGIHLTYTI